MATKWYQICPKNCEYATKIKIKNLTLYAFQLKIGIAQKGDKTLMSILINTLKKKLIK